jgi:DNA-binding beta-propeller fold protein YncE
VLTTLLRLPFVPWAVAEALPQRPSEMASRIRATPVLPFHAEHLAARSKDHNFESGLVSSVAVSGDGLIYELQRGDKADPVLVLDSVGQIVSSWGRGEFKLPHSVRVDADGNIWTVDASWSAVFKYSSTGKKLLTIHVGGQPKTDRPFSGATDIAIAPNGHLFITDGYGNARVIEFSATGRRLRQWGTAGEGPGQFHLPHGIQISAEGIIYVADRENGRIEEFDLNGNYLGEIANLGRVYSLKLDGDFLWAGTQSLEQNPGAPGWIVKLDRRSGEMLGHLAVKEPFGLHSIDLSPSGEPVTNLGNQILWFRRNSPEP